MGGGQVRERERKREGEKNKRYKDLKVMIELDFL